jgi:hypothetical protein
MTANKWAVFEKIGYKPHSKEQRSYHESTTRFRVPVCGRRFGKSTMAGADVIPRMFEPNTLGWIVGPTYDLGEKEFRVIWDHLIVGLGMGLDKRVKKAYNKRMGDMYIEMPWGARVEVRSASQPERLVGEKLHWCLMSEAAKHSAETWERFIRPALADYRGTADFPTTPEGYNWLYALWQLGFDDSFPEFACWQFPSWTNPIVFPLGRDDPEIRMIERTTSEAWFLQEIAADFSAFVGKIFEEFTEPTHVKNIEYRPEWRNYIFFDFGYVNPLAAIEVMISPSDDVYIWREHYKSYMRVEEHCEELKARDQPAGYHLDMCFGDAADPEAAETVSVYLAPCIAMNEAKENWRQGVDLMKKFLKMRVIGEDESGAPIEAPKLFVDPSCRNVIREFNLYKAPSKLKSNMKESSTTSAAVKIDDHAMDAIRYGLMHVFELGATYSLADVMVSKSALQAPYPGEMFALAGSGGFTTLNEGAF